MQVSFAKDARRDLRNLFVYIAKAAGVQVAEA